MEVQHLVETPAIGCPSAESELCVFLKKRYTAFFVLFYLLFYKHLCSLFHFPDTVLSFFQH